MTIPIPTAQHPTLKSLINETYTDGVESILDARLEDDGAIIVVARDEDRIVAFKYTDEQVSVRVLNPEVIEGEEEEPQPKTDSQYSHISFKPPQGVINAAKRALRATESGQLKIGSGMEASTKSWVKRVAKGEPITPAKAKQGYRWFKRNARFKNAEKDSPAWAAWAYWFYGEGQSWFNKLWRQMEAAEAKADAEPFIPASPDGDFQNLSRLITRFDWETVRSIATEQVWTWNDEEGRYFDKDGELVTYQQILDVTQAELSQFEEQIEGATAFLIDGDATVPEWEELIAEITVSAALLFLLFGLGSRTPDSISESMVRSQLEKQFGFLQTFAKSVLLGQMTVNGINARAKLYVHDAQLLYSKAQDLIHPVDIWPFYRNILGPCEHCVQCPQETMKGIVPRGALAPIGGRLCKWRCCCQLGFHKTQDERFDGPTILDLETGWL